MFNAGALSFFKPRLHLKIFCRFCTETSKTASVSAYEIFNGVLRAILNVNILGRGAFLIKIWGLGSSMFMYYTLL